MSYAVDVKPGVTSPFGAEKIDASKVSMSVKPSGRIKTLLDKLTGEYSTLQQYRIAQTFFDLDDAGILAKMDGLFFRGLSEADCLVNWIDGKADAANNGAAFVAGEGLVLDGTADYILTGDDQEKYTLASAFAFAYATAAPSTASEPLIGRDGVDDVLRIYPYGGGGTNANGRMHSGNTFNGAYTGTRTGLWGISRTGTTVELARNGVSIFNQTGDAATVIAPNITIGKNSTSFGDWTVGAFGYGGYLTLAEQLILTAAVEAMQARI